MKSKIFITVLVFLCICSIFLNGILIMREDYINKLFVKLGLKEEILKTDLTLIGWENCIKYMNYNADITFFGDSIVSGGDFKKYFPEIETIINLGLPGDTLYGMYNRIEMLISTNPKKIFILGGINSLKNTNIESCVMRYDTMISDIKEGVPNVQLYIQSVLPISEEKERICADNSMIRQFNQRLEAISQKYNCIYIDLYSLYEKDGYMNPELTSDGVHLKPEAYNLWAVKIKDYIEK